MSIIDDDGITTVEEIRRMGLAFRIERYEGETPAEVDASYSVYDLNEDCAVGQLYSSIGTARAKVESLMRAEQVRQRQAQGRADTLRRREAEENEWAAAQDRADFALQVQQAPQQRQTPAESLPAGSLPARLLQATERLAEWAETKERAYTERASAAAAHERLERDAMAIISAAEVGGKKEFTNEAARKAELARLTAQPGNLYQSANALRKADGQLRRAGQQFDTWHEQVKSLRAILRYEAERMALAAALAR